MVVVIVVSTSLQIFSVPNAWDKLLRSKCLGQAVVLSDIFPHEFLHMSWGKFTHQMSVFHPGPLTDINLLHGSKCLGRALEHEVWSSGGVWLGLVQSGWAWLGLVGSGFVWFGLVGSGWVWLGLVVSG